MLDLFTVFTQGGVVLYTYEDAQRKVDGDPVNALVQTVFIEGKGVAGEPFNYDKYGIQYRRDNENGLIFVAVYPALLSSELEYVAPLLNRVQTAFATQYGEDVRAQRFGDFSSTFEPVFQTLYKTAEKEFAVQAKRTQEPRRFENTKKFAKSVQGSNTAMKEILKAPATSRRANDEQTDESSDGEREDEEEEGSDGGDEEATEGTDANATRDPSGGLMKPDALAKLQRLKRRGKSATAPKRSAKTPPASKPSQRAREKLRDDEGPKTLDYSTGGGQGAREDDEDLDEDTKNRYREMASQRGNGQLPGISFEPSKADAGDTGGIFSYFKNLAGSSAVTRENLEPVLEKMRHHLVGKNVAADIADRLCQSVCEKLEGTTKGSFQSLSAVVRKGLEESLTQILSPKRHIDVLRDIRDAQREKRPFTITFCGVNGVGKSTNLAKIAFWLLSNNLRVLIAACDTFRAGAVEQLRTHCRKLKHTLGQKDDDAPIITLYDRGYGKDDAGVAADAIRFARDDGYDVVLVDTAGRMQDNEPLMRSLAKLIRVNEPDLVLFVGEALVGNEAVDQLTKFNAALMDHSDVRNPRTIDGIVLTKFDTVDDKVGSSISMTYTTGQPIVFVGTGQDYGDLKKLDVPSVVNALLK